MTASGDPAIPENNRFAGGFLGSGRLNCVGIKPCGADSWSPVLGLVPLVSNASIIVISSKMSPEPIKDEPRRLGQQLRCHCFLVLFLDGLWEQRRPMRVETINGCTAFRT